MKTKEFNSKKWQFIDALMADRHLTAAAKAVAYVLISTYYSKSYGYAFPPVEKLAKRAGMSERTISRVNGELAKSGWFKVTKGGAEKGRKGGWANQYKPVWIRAIPHVEDDSNVDDDAVHGETEVVQDFHPLEAQDDESRDFGGANDDQGVTDLHLGGDKVAGEGVTELHPIPFMNIPTMNPVPLLPQRARCRAPHDDATNLEPEIRAEDYHSNLADLIGWDVMTPLKRADVDRLALELSANGDEAAICLQVIDLATAVPSRASA